MKNQDLFIRKFIVVILFMIGFTATDILGQMPARVSAGILLISCATP